MSLVVFFSFFHFFISYSESFIITFYLLFAFLPSGMNVPNHPNEKNGTASEAAKKKPLIEEVKPAATAAGTDEPPKEKKKKVCTSS